MTKSLMISIQPQHAFNILNGKKTLELRTWIPKDYVGWVYVYVTKGKKDILHKYKDKYYTNHYLTFTDSVEVLNSKVVARFWFDEHEKIDFNNIKILQEIKQKSCIDDIQFIFDYAKGKDLYAWHIDKLEIFDEPKELSEFALVSNYKHIVEKMTPYEKSMLIFGNTLKKAPQRSVWVYTKENEK